MRRKAVGIVAVLFIMGLAPAAAGLDCKGWNTNEFFKQATAADVIRCLKAGADPNARGEPRPDLKGITPLHWAAVYGKPALIKPLATAGADPNARSEDGVAPLHTAANSTHGNPAVIKALIVAGAAPNAQDKNGNTPFDYLVRKGSSASAEVAAVLIEHGADFSLRVAVMKNAARIVAVMIEHGADANAKVKSGQTLLHWAARARADKVSAVLIEHGANVNAKTESGTTPLHVAASRNADKVAAVLIEHGADINARSEIGTPLQSAIQKDSAKVAVLLILEGGVNLKATLDRFGETWLHYAAQRNAAKIVAVMIERGADVNAKDWLGRTPLHEASAGHSSKAAAALIESGANVNARIDHARVDSGMTPLHLAASGSKRHSRSDDATRILAVLIEHGADINAKDSKGRTPLYMAWRRRDTAPALIKYGARLEPAPPQAARVLTQSECLDVRGACGGECRDLRGREYIQCQGGCVSQKDACIEKARIKDIQGLLQAERAP